MATLTTYTQALQHIATLEFDTPKLPLKAFSFIPNGQPNGGHTLTLEYAMKSDAPILHGHIYRIDADWFTPSIYGRLHNATMTAADTELQFKPLSAEAEKIVRAVLAELDAHETKPADTLTEANSCALTQFVSDALFLSNTNARARKPIMTARRNMKDSVPFTFTWDRGSPYVQYRESSEAEVREGMRIRDTIRSWFREGEGNNP